LADHAENPSDDDPKKNGSSHFFYLNPAKNTPTSVSGRDEFVPGSFHCLNPAKNLSLEDAMDAYYNSRLSAKVHVGKYGVQYLDYRNLVRILIESEPELFE
jgi:hypothetical protein